MIPISASNPFVQVMYDEGIINLKEPTPIQLVQAIGLDHFFVSFLVETDIIDELISLQAIRVNRIIAGRYIITASLQEWTHLLKAGLVKTSSTELRELLGLIYIFLRDSGFSMLFSNIKRNTYHDGTIIFA